MKEQMSRMRTEQINLLREVMAGCRKTGDRHYEDIKVRQDITDFSTVNRAIKERNPRR
jgi:hypothetical protein